MSIHLCAGLPAQLGRSAVEAFFCISGMLITMVASGSYRNRPLAFLANRFLRIYPVYWLCLAIAFVLVHWIPNGNYLHPSLYLPKTSSDAAANFLVFGLTQNTASRLLPAAWSLDTELCFYLVIGLFTAARSRLTLVLLLLTVLLSTAAALGAVPVAFYGTPIGNAYAFFIGSAVWQYRGCLRASYSRICLWTGFVLFEALAWAPAVAHPGLPVFLSAPVIGLMLTGFCGIRLTDNPGLAKFGAFAGRLTYPVFLLHWPIGLLVYHLFGVWQDWRMLLLSAIFSLAISAIIVCLYERPLEQIRATIRSGHAHPRKDPRFASAIGDAIPP